MDVGIKVNELPVVIDVSDEYRRCPTNSQKTYDCDPMVWLQGTEDSDSDHQDAFTALVAARIKAVPIEGAGGTPQATPKKRRRGEQA